MSVQSGEGAFTFSAATGIRHNRALAAEAKIFSEDLEKLTGSPPKVVSKELKILLPSEILLDLDSASDLPPSGYRLEITPKEVRIIGKDSAGAFYGTRTLLQLLPAGKLAGESAQINSVSIADQPRFNWRGIMLDVGRNYQKPEGVKRFIDWMAFHKLNTFHWHLTDDQGWRIEIKKYPKLTEIGAFRNSSPPYGNRNSDDGVCYGGFYTQEQIKDIVGYASARHITVVPEIEMPGHAAAAIAAYPELGNTDIPGYAPKVICSWNVHPYIFAPKEETFRFLEDVLAEVCELFPSTYIHIGGDEARKIQWQQSRFAQDRLG